jgi:hypothetical protein
VALSFGLGSFLMILGSEILLRQASLSNPSEKTHLLSGVKSTSKTLFWWEAK